MSSPHKLDALRLTAFLSVLTAMLPAACTGGQTVYHDWRPVPEKGWRPADTLRFDLEAPYTQATYHLTIGVRNSAGYPYRNLPLAVCCTDSGNRARFSDTLHISLAGEEGYWTGTGIGGLYYTEAPLPDARLQGPAVYTLKVVHLLPDTLLNGVVDIDIAVTR